MAVEHNLGFPAPPRGLEYLRHEIRRKIQSGIIELAGSEVTLDPELIKDSTFELGRRKFDRRGRPIATSRVLGHFATPEEIADHFETMGETLSSISETT